MKWFFLCVALAAAGVFLAHEGSTATVLRAELEHYRLQRAELEAQQRERTRLLALQPTAAERAHLQAAVAMRTERRRAMDAAEFERREAQLSQVGEWIPQSQSHDCGQSTPRAALQTMLWASAGGDTGRLAHLLDLDESARAKLETIFARLPAQARANHASAEQLLAAFTAKAIPLGDTQVVWQQQSGENAVVCFWINQPAAAAPLDAAKTPPADPRTPPMLPPHPKRSQGLLALRRSDDGWRIVVPSFAIDKLGRELAVAQ